MEYLVTVVVVVHKNDNDRNGFLASILRGLFIFRKKKRFDDLRSGGASTEPVTLTGLLMLYFFAIGVTQVGRYATMYMYSTTALTAEWFFTLQKKKSIKSYRN
jgi:hypothetical protein